MSIIDHPCFKTNADAYLFNRHAGESHPLTPPQRPARERVVVVPVGDIDRLSEEAFRAEILAQANLQAELDAIDDNDPDSWMYDLTDDEFEQAMLERFS